MSRARGSRWENKSYGALLCKNSQPYFFENPTWEIIAIQNNYAKLPCTPWKPWAAC